MTTFIADSQREFRLPEGEVNFQTLVQLFPQADAIVERYSTLERAIGQLDFNFYQELLPQLTRWASEHVEQSKLIRPLEAGTTARLVYTAQQIRYLLANAFFLNVTPGYGNLDLRPIYNSLFDSLASQRIRCLIEYFRISSEGDEHREIAIERYWYGEGPSKDWSEQTMVIDPAKIHVFTGRMEEATDAQGFVDFANKHIHIHRIIASATQEEVLFSCCPEAFVSILVCETLLDDEIVLLRGCKRFVDYVGYSESFRYQGRHQQAADAPVQDILVLDACFSGQFTPTNLHRDLGKALAGFEYSRNERIVTGHWGCGVFGGDFVLKFLQQACAVMVLNEQVKRLDYSVYGDQPLATYFTGLLGVLAEKRKTVADVYQMMLSYHSPEQLPATRIAFRQFVDQWLENC